MNNSKKITTVGLTGNIGSGKSTALKIFGKLDCRTISTDKIAHELIDSNESVRNNIIDAFGSDILNADGSIDRERIANIVFSNDVMLKELELILHPEIEKVVHKELETLPDGTTAVIEIPLLFETGWDTKLDHTVLLTCPFETRQERYLKDGTHTPEDFTRRNKMQWDEERKSKLASHVIDNSEDKAYLETNIKKYLDTL